MSATRGSANSLSPLSLTRSGYRRITPTLELGAQGGNFTWICENPISPVQDGVLAATSFISGDKEC
jgi:hypothetical protein